MSLSMLVGGGAECGPSNPLQSLSKRFDQDRGVQQDVAGSSSARSRGPLWGEQFRSQQAPMPGELQQEAARFFSGPAPLSVQAQPHIASVEPLALTSGPSSMRMVSMPAQQPFDVAGLRDALPIADGPVQRQEPLIGGAWASDFLARQPVTVQQANVSAARVDQQVTSPIGGIRGGAIPWSSAYAGYRVNVMPGVTNTMAAPVQRHVVQSDQVTWDKEFQSQESLLKATSIPAISGALPDQQLERLQDGKNVVPPDDMARLAAQVIDAVKHEQNPKFQQSQFMNLMRQLRDGEVTVQEDSIVSRAQNNDITMDVKGKGRAHDVAGLSSFSAFSSSQSPSGVLASSQGAEQMNVASDPHEVYFRQENAELAEYWNAHYTGPTARTSTAAQGNSTEWDRMQRDWDAFEATTTGVKPVAHYQFQTNNPYLLGDSSTRTRHHDAHMSYSQRVYENVLELEAAVQRDPTNAAAWFELGVKQQENEREAKAIQALERAIELDPSHLSTWLALSVSYTNDGNRLETCYAIRQWMLRNPKYKTVVSAAMPQMRGGGNGGFEELIEVLIQMARYGGQQEGGGVDADVQVALAVLLNAAEDYSKAVDCFLAALAVRPDDWLLYNRVGATMANNGQGADALEYYHRALEMNPGYIRARFNLGISCINLRRYDEAASHILDALVLQDSDGVEDGTGMNDARGVTSSALWESLKTTSLHLRRPDLAALCDARNLDGFRRTFYGM